jgi:hypothetical protein
MNRDQLTALLDMTIDAMQAREARRLPLAAAVRYTENGQRIPFGKGIWATATPGGEGTRAVLADPASGQAGWFGALNENGNPVVMALRLKTEDGAIAELESVICRGHERIFDPAAMASRRAGFGGILPPAERTPPEHMIGAGNSYFDGIERGDGGIIPATDDCARVENGTQTTLNAAAAARQGTPLWGMDVCAQISTGYYGYIEAIRDRRWPIVDQECGQVLGIVCFDHPGNVKSVEVKGRGRVELPPFTQKPSTALIAELFQLRAGRITGIEAVLDFFPYGMKTGWH